MSALEHSDLCNGDTDTDDGIGRENEVPEFLYGSFKKPIY